MASVTHRVSTPSTSNTTTYASGAFTPAVGDLLVVCVTATATVATGTCTNSAGTTFTRIRTALKASSADTLYLFVANTLVSSATSQTCTFDCTGDAASGAIVSVMLISGMSRTGSSAVAKSAGQSNGAAAATPTVALGSAANTNNALIGFVGNATSPATLTQPTSWSELFDGTGFGSPTTGQEVVSINSGFTGSTVTWASTSASAFGAIVAEFDVALAPVTGSFAATETGSDTAAASGKVLVKGTGAATEPTKDTLAATGKIIVKGSGAATDTGPDTAAASGKVIAKGSGAATETGNDVLSGSGKVIVKGSGAFTEPANDTTVATGQIFIKGSGACLEATDQAAAAGKVFVNGLLAASETASDSAVATGKVFVRATVALLEIAADVSASTGRIIVKGAGSSIESGADTLAATGQLSALSVNGSMSALEMADQATGTGQVKVHGLATMAESGLDILDAVGTDDITGAAYLVEMNRDSVAATGSVKVQGLGAWLENADLCVAGGVVVPFPIYGDLAAIEGLDLFLAKGPEVRALPAGGIGRTRAFYGQSAPRAQSSPHRADPNPASRAASTVH